MARNDQGNSHNQQPGFMVNKKLFHYQENEACKKKRKGQQTVMMLVITMVKGIRPNAKGEQNHPNFKPDMMNDVDSK